VNKTLVGVTLHFCDSQNTASTVEVDINAVGAVSWEKEKIKEKDKDKDGTDSIPQETVAADCTSADAQALAVKGICWWNGTQWVCGE